MPKPSEETVRALLTEINNKKTVLRKELERLEAIEYSLGSQLPPIRGVLNIGLEDAAVTTRRR